VRGLDPRFVLFFILNFLTDCVGCFIWAWVWPKLFSWASVPTHLSCS